jgi:hypothetical protein
MFLSSGICYQHWLQLEYVRENCVPYVTTESLRITVYRVIIIFFILKTAHFIRERALFLKFIRVLSSALRFWKLLVADFQSDMLETLMIVSYFAFTRYISPCSLRLTANKIIF